MIGLAPANHRRSRPAESLLLSSEYSPKLFPTRRGHADMDLRAAAVLLPWLSVQLMHSSLE